MHSVPHDAGERQIATIGAPGAGANLDYILPNHYRYILDAIYFDLATDANAADRYPHLHFSITGMLLVKVVQSIKVEASDLARISLWAGLGVTSYFSGVWYGGSLPPHVYLYGGDHILSAIENLQVGDAITNVSFMLRRWPEQDS